MINTRNVFKYLYIETRMWQERDFLFSHQIWVQLIVEAKVHVHLCYMERKKEKNIQLIGNDA